MVIKYVRKKQYIIITHNVILLILFLFIKLFAIKPTNLYYFEKIDFLLTQKKKWVARWGSSLQNKMTATLGYRMQTENYNFIPQCLVNRQDQLNSFQTSTFTITKRLTETTLTSDAAIVASMQDHENEPSFKQNMASMTFFTLENIWFVTRISYTQYTKLYIVCKRWCQAPTTWVYLWKSNIY